MGCGVANNIGVIGKNLTRLATPHPYSVEEGKEQEVLASGKSIVDLDFGEGTGTAWRRVNPDGSIDPKDYTLSYLEIGDRGRKRSQIPPGTYFLNGVMSETESVMSGYYIRSIDVIDFGWDETKKEARCFSFTVKPGEMLIIPDVLMANNPLMRENKTICPKLSFKGAVPEGAPYSIGPESRK